MPGKYHEVVVEGAKGRAYGFLEGFLSGRGPSGDLYEMESEGFDCEPLRERIRQMVHPSEEIYHLLVREEDLATVREAVAEASARGLHLVVHDDREVAGARFSFRFAIYSPEHAAKIRRWFEEPPPGVSLSLDAKIEERLHPEDKGIEAYAPVHDYELIGEGSVEGPVEGVIELHRRCRQEQLVHTDALQIVLPA